MWEFGALLLPLAAVGVGLLNAFGQHRRRLQVWQEAAAACGLEAGEVPVWSPKLTARAGLVTVTIEKSGNKGRYARVTVWVPGPSDFRAVGIRREPLLRLGREIEIGDSSFDSTFFIEGPARLVLAWLDAETRPLLMRVNAESRLEISTGALRASDMSDEKISQVLPLLLDIGRRLPQQADIPRRLAENANRDPETWVRLQNLRLMIHELPKNPMTREALRTARSDPSPVIRLRAARGLGAEGRDLLLDLAESLEDDAVSAEAVSALDRELPFERTRAILDQALDRRFVQTARACLATLGKSGDAAAVDVLVKVLALAQGELAAAAAVALGETGSPAAEPPLLDAFQRGEASLRMAAARALGCVGSVAAVLPLKEATERHWLDLELRQATRQAVAEIQARLQGASPGQLSLAGTEAGQLSLVQSEAGQLSLAQAEAGQLTLPSGELEPGQLSRRDAEEDLKPGGAA